MPQNKVKQGLAGQQAAEDYLTEKGWLILSRNFRTKAGEIDLIGKDGAYIVFAEVKLRRGLSYGYPRESVNYSKQQRIKKAALYYITQENLQDQDFRFDVMEIFDANGILSVNHIENAFW